MVTVEIPSGVQSCRLCEVRFLLNTIPLVNRKLVTMQHDFTRRGNIVALPCENNRFLLNIESFQDDGNHQYIDVGQCYDEHPCRHL